MPERIVATKYSRVNESLNDWKSGEVGGNGNLVNKLRSEATGHVSSCDAAIIRVMPFRKGSVLDAGKEIYSFSVSSRADCLVKW